MKKIAASVLALVLSLCLVACHGQANLKPSTTDDRPLVTVTTSFLNDMVKVLADDYVRRDLIIPAGEDPHLYLAKASDLTKLQSADLVLYHGLHFEGKMIDALEQTGVAVTKSFADSDLNEMDDDGQTVTDPHFWFDIRLYKQAVLVASEELQQLVPKHKAAIAQNTETYLNDLDALDAWNKEQLAQLPEGSRYLVTPHDAFNYFARQYGFTLYAPQGISTDSEVANSDMIATVNMIINHNIKAIFTESTTNPARMEKLREAVAARGGQVEVVSGEGKELFSDSLAPEGHDGDSYIEMYRHNVGLIVTHLK